MNPATRPLAFATAALVTACTGTAHVNAAVYTGSNGTGIWSDALNWSSSDIADTAGETAQINPSSVEVDSNFTIGLLQNSFGSASGTIDGTGTLTIDRNAAAAGAAIQNVNGSGVTQTIDTNVVINNSGGGISWIRNLNSASNTVAFGPNSTLQLATNVEVVQAIGGGIEFNGAVTGNAALRVANNNVSFGSTADLSGFTGELVMLGGALTDDTAAGNGLAVSKIQTNVNSSLTINNANSVTGQPLLAFSGSPQLDLTVNGDQQFGNLNLGSAYANVTLGPSVNYLGFLFSASFDWTGGTLNINDFRPGVIDFGPQGGLTAQQISQITIDGVAPSFSLFLNADGKLVPEPASLGMIVGGLALAARRRRA